MPDLPDGLDVVPVDYQPDFAGPWQQLPHLNGVPQITIPLSQTAQQTNLGDQPTPKAGQTVQQPNVMSDISSMPGKVAGAAADVTGVSDAYKAATGQMTPEEAQMFALGALPALAAGPEEKIAQSVADDVMPAAAKAIRAFHGSPYDFDQFDLSKIGTGEGAQAYGHGLYFAENPQTAQSYRGVQNFLDTPENLAAAYLDKYEVPDTAIKKITQDLANAPDDMPFQQHATAALKLLQSGQEPKPGKMYEVNINADPEHFLDWDKPLSEQHPVVQGALKKVGVNIPPPPPVTNIKDPAIRSIVRSALRQNDGQAEGLNMIVDNDYPLYKQAQAHAAKAGRDLDAEDTRAGDYVYSQAQPYLDALHKSQIETPASVLQRAYKNEMFAGDIVGKDRASPAELTQALHDAGIPGIKYLDQGSRGSGDGTRNFVVFNHKMIDIVKKYGLAGLVAGGASHFQTVPVDNQPDFGEVH